MTQVRKPARCPGTLPIRLASWTAAVQPQGQEHWAHALADLARPGPEFISPKVRKEAHEFFHSWEVPQLLLVNEAPCCHKTSAEGERTWVSLIHQAPAAGIAQVDRHNGSSVTGLPSTVSPSQGHLGRPESPGACKLWEALLRSGEQHPGWKMGAQLPGPW